MNWQRCHLVLMWVCAGVNLGAGITNLITGDWLIAMDELIFGCLFLSMNWAARMWRLSGHRRARIEMWASLAEARQRGLSFYDWVQGEHEKDALDARGGGR